MKDLQNILDRYVHNQNDGELNFLLATNYDRLGNKAAACSYYLRAAELVSSEERKSECLRNMAWLYYLIGDRYDEVELLANYSISHTPMDPRAHCIKCVAYCEQCLWMDLLNYSKLCMSINFDTCELNNYYVDPTIFLFYAGYALLNLGMKEEGTKYLSEVALKSKNRFVARQAVQAIDSVGSRVSYLDYNLSKFNNLRPQLVNDVVKQVKTNYSQCMQDMFVLTATSGLTNGTYLEFGSADPIIHSNTKLLEELGWSGLSIEIDKTYADRFNLVRKNKCLNVDALSIDYNQVIGNHFNKGSFIDYLQVDCDPSTTSFEILKRVISTEFKFGIVTFEHDSYISGIDIRDQARKFMSKYGYILVRSNVGMMDMMQYEDWYIHKDYELALKYYKDTASINSFTSIQQIFYR